MPHNGTGLTVHTTHTHMTHLLHINNFSFCPEWKRIENDGKGNGKFNIVISRITFFVLCCDAEVNRGREGEREATRNPFLNFKWICILCVGVYSRFLSLIFASILFYLFHFPLPFYSAEDLHVLASYSWSGFGIYLLSSVGRQLKQIRIASR